MYKKIVLSFSLLLCLQSPTVHAMEEITDTIFVYAAMILATVAVVGGAIYYQTHYGNDAYEAKLKQ